MLKRRPQDERKGSHGAFGAAAEADDLAALRVVVLKRTGHLVEEIGELGREVMGR